MKRKLRLLSINVINEKNKEKKPKIYSKFKNIKFEKFTFVRLAIRKRINFIGKTSGVGDLCRTNVADSMSPGPACSRLALEFARIFFCVYKYNDFWVNTIFFIHTFYRLILYILMTLGKL